ncbi:sensory transduction histidine kinase [Candidatus Vecturithrix granuli]|uniref:histidine kinase n=1 Tax=Vecturithrix granuli TaxID=1499967 RepID=A0A081C1M0_VECG1|nr:sensory transduction histidine kinase [Candidatus Vecturithrix granuli]
MPNMPIIIVVVNHNTELQWLISQIFHDSIEAGDLEFVYFSETSEAVHYLVNHPQASILLAEVDSAHPGEQTLLATVHEYSPLLPVILIVPDEEMSFIRSLMNQGAYDFLMQPVDQEDLSRTIDKAIRYTRRVEEHGIPSIILENQLAQLKKAIDTMRLGVTISDLQGQIVYANPADARMHGYALDELLGKDVGVYAPPELRQPMALEEIAQCQGSIRESVNIRKDGSQFPVWLISDIIKDAEGTPVAIVTSCEDITERKHVEAELEQHRHNLEDLITERTKELRVINAELQQEIAERKKAEDALRESELEYRSLFENLPDLFYRLDRAGHLLLVSPSITQFLGYAPEEAIGLHLANEILVYPEQWKDFQLLMEADGHLENFEILLKRKDGSFEWGNANAKWYTDHEGQIAGFEGIIRDISIRKQAEIELLVAHDELQKTNVQLQELNASKDKFFSIISHDLRSQFATLLGFTEIIENRIETYNPKRLKELIKKLKNSAEQLYELFENLLTWSRVQRGAMHHDPKKIHLFVLAEANLKMMQPKAELKQIDLRNNVAKDIQAYADSGMLNTVIRNLLSNALKFTDSGGIITIAAISQEQQIEMSIADTGHGIDEKAKDLLFRMDKTYTTTGTAGEHGTGLGLILCQDLVEKNGGRIWVESEPGKGTTFFFSMPRFAEENPEPPL